MNSLNLYFIESIITTSSKTINLVKFTHGYYICYFDKLELYGTQNVAYFYRLVFSHLTYLWKLYQILKCFYANIHIENEPNLLVFSF